MLAKTELEDGLGSQIDGRRDARNDAFDRFTRPSADSLDMQGVQPHVFPFNHEYGDRVKAARGLERDDERLEYFGELQMTTCRFSYFKDELRARRSPIANLKALLGRTFHLGRLPQPAGCLLCAGPPASRLFYFFDPRQNRPGYRFVV